MAEPGEPGEAAARLRLAVEMVELGLGGLPEAAPPVPTSLQRAAKLKNLLDQVYRPNPGQQVRWCLSFFVWDRL